jgi:5-formyltetrahydrofolate cyclo-ligase
MSVVEEKKRLRALARARRREASAGVAAGAGERLAERYLEAMAGMGHPGPGAVVSGYWPMAEEMDVRPLLARLFERGYPLALPVVVGKGEPLDFRSWAPGTALEDGVFGTRHPGPDRTAARPRVALVPLLAFDRRGYRLGWGAGFYDRTITALRAEGPLLAVGVAYALQEVASVPHADTDARLDWVATEAGVVPVAAAAAERGP